MANSPLIRPYLLGGSFEGGILDSHDYYFMHNFWSMILLYCWKAQHWLAPPLVCRFVIPKSRIYLENLAPKANEPARDSCTTRSLTKKRHPPISMHIP